LDAVGAVGAFGKRLFLRRFKVSFEMAQLPGMEGANLSGQSAV
jgi:hypothetical protein